MVDSEEEKGVRVSKVEIVITKDGQLGAKIAAGSIDSIFAR